MKHTSKQTLGQDGPLLHETWSDTGEQTYRAVHGCCHADVQAFGVICSPTANSAFDGRHAYVPAWEDVLVWDVKTGSMLAMWHSQGLTSPVAFIAPAPLPASSSSAAAQTFSVAYQDGSIRLWSFNSSTPEVEATEIVTFNGHKKAPTTMVWDEEGSRLASGGTEGEIVVWDTVAEVGLFRLRGHRGPVTSIRFIPHPTLSVTAHPGYLLSTSKDTYLKLWDLSTQHCVQTVVVGRGEVTSCDAMEEVGEEEGQGRWIVVTGSGDGEAKVWSIAHGDLTAGLAENAQGEVSTFTQGHTKDKQDAHRYSCQHWSSRYVDYLSPSLPTLSHRSSSTHTNRSSSFKLRIDPPLSSA